MWVHLASHSIPPLLPPRDQLVVCNMLLAVVQLHASIAQGIHLTATMAARCSILRLRLVDSRHLLWLRL